MLISQPISYSGSVVYFNKMAPPALLIQDFIRSLYKVNKMNVEWGYHVCPSSFVIFKITHRISTISGITN
jgi:hypothetical protein